MFILMYTPKCFHILDKSSRTRVQVKKKKKVLSTTTISYSKSIQIPGFFFRPLCCLTKKLHGRGSLNIMAIFLNSNLQVTKLD